MRRNTRTVSIGAVHIGGNHPIAIQSMTNTDTRDVASTRQQIIELYQAGCKIVRLAVPDDDALRAFEQLVNSSPVPLVADIHYDFRLAVGAIERGAAKVRINPGNIGGMEQVRAVMAAALRHGAAVRFGVNSGSLPREVLAKHGGPTPEAMVEAALLYSAEVTASGFNNLVFSLKSSDVFGTIKAYELFSRQSDYPLHVGVTEAGTLLKGAVRSAVGIGVLLSQGIGDTVRVSLTADPVAEVGVAKEILASLNLGPRQLQIVSCPTCARTSGDLITIAEIVEKSLQDYAGLALKVAVMGCSVNGPGEAREAHVGIALAKGKAVLFKHGEPVDLVPLSLAASRLIEEVKLLASTYGE